LGPAASSGGYETSKGYGGWGSGAEGKLKFSPTSRGVKKSEHIDEEEEEEKRETGGDDGKDND
jgi:hypothetical protein